MEGKHGISISNFLIRIHYINLVLISLQICFVLQKYSNLLARLCVNSLQYQNIIKLLINIIFVINIYNTHTGHQPTSTRCPLFLKGFFVEFFLALVSDHRGRNCVIVIEGNGIYLI